MHTISAEQLLKAYNGKYKYLVMNRSGNVYLYTKKPSAGDVTDWWSHESAAGYCLGKVAITEFQGKDWTECIYKAKPSEEDMIGCVGWFWDDDTDSKRENLGILKNINHDSEYPYEKKNGNVYIKFHPATRDEIKFFNDDTSEV